VERRVENEGSGVLGYENEALGWSMRMAATAMSVDMHMMMLGRRRTRRITT
jgi:hypothetical protein